MWLLRACERSGKRSAAGRKLSERERSGEPVCQKTMERGRSEERGIMGCERSGERTKLAAQISLKGDTKTSYALQSLPTVNQF